MANTKQYIIDVTGDEWEPVIIYDDSLKVAFADIGEGYNGDYDPDNPEDAPLLRLDIMIKEPEDVDEDFYDCTTFSYCTCIVANTPVKTLTKLLLLVHEAFRKAIDEEADEGQLKLLAERCSYLTADDEEIPKLNN